MSAQGRRGVIGALAAASIAGGATGIAVAQLGDTVADPQARPNAVVTAIDPGQSASFSVLRGETGEPATLTPAAAALVETGLGPDVGASAALARRAGSTPDGTPLYVLPGRGWVCLATGEGDGGCNRTDAVVEGYGIVLERQAGGTAVSGMVPDGVTTVEVRGAGEVVEAPVAANVWSAVTSFDPQTIRWTGADDTQHDVPVWAPPPDAVAGELP